MKWVGGNGSRGINLLEVLLSCALIIAVLAGILLLWGAQRRTLTRDHESDIAMRVVREVESELEAVAMRQPGGGGELSVMEMLSEGIEVRWGAAREGALIRDTDGPKASRCYYLVALVLHEQPELRTGVSAPETRIIRVGVSWPYRMPSGEGFREIASEQRDSLDCLLSVRAYPLIE